MRGDMVAHDVICITCGNHFLSTRCNKICCGPVCAKKHAVILAKIGYLKRANGLVKVSKPLPNRPFERGTAISIVADRLRGQTVKDIAKVLSRNAEHVQRFIDHIESNGVADKIRAKLIEFDLDSKYYGGW